MALPSFEADSEAVAEEPQSIVDHLKGLDDETYTLLSDDDAAYGTTIRNQGDGGHLRVRNKAGSANVLEVTDSGVTIVGNLTRRGGPVYNVKDFGAKGDGSTDDTSAIVAAITAMGTGTTAGGILYFPRGQYVISSEIVLSRGMTLMGDGRGQSVINSSSATANLIRFTADSDYIKVVGLGFAKTPSGQPSTAGVGIYCDPADFAADTFPEVEIYDCRFSFLYEAIRFENCIDTRIQNCTFANQTSKDIVFRYGVAPYGAGDHHMTGNIHQNADTNNLYGVVILSGAGFHFGDNKFLGYQHQILMQIETGVANLSNFFMSGPHSMEGTAGSDTCINFLTDGPDFANVILGGGAQFGIAGSGSSALVNIGTAGTWMDTVLIEGCQFHPQSATTTAIGLAGGNDIDIKNCQFAHVGGGTAISNSAGTNVRSAGNTFLGTGTDHSGTFAHIEPKVQFKSVAMTATNAALGNLFKGPASSDQTWPEAFRVTPHTIAYVGITEGALQAVIDSKDEDSFTAHAVGAATGTAYTFMFIGMADS